MDLSAMYAPYYALSLALLLNVDLPSRYGPSAKKVPPIEFWPTDEQTGKLTVG
jgi:hypothetical protein